MGGLRERLKDGRALLLALASLASVSAWAEDAWKYSEEADKMTSKVTKFATLISTSSLSLGSPYQGANYAHIHVRQRAGSAPEVMLTINKGQMMCRSFKPCAIKVRFDDAPPVSFSGTGSSDHDPTIAFIQGASKFIAGASKAKTILVQTEIFHNGVPIMEFKPNAPLVWGIPPKPKAK
ncbi:MAG: hypothetical protein Q8N13_10420 [Acidovorax sp.]|nr:hypothetical protein [Acidovorax sp.]